HTINASLDHAFDQRYRVGIRDSFVIGQEPDTLRNGGYAFATYQRVPGDNIRNYGAINFNAQLTRNFGIELGYANGYVDYDDSGPSTNRVVNIVGTNTPVEIDSIQASHSGTLDRVEHTIHLDGRWQLQPETTGIIGYQFGQVDYIGNEPIGGVFTTNGFVF